MAVHPFRRRIGDEERREEVIEGGEEDEGEDVEVEEVVDRQEPEEEEVGDEAEEEEEVDHPIRVDAAPPRPIATIEELAELMMQDEDFAREVRAAVEAELDRLEAEEANNNNEEDVMDLNPDPANGDEDR